MKSNINSNIDTDSNNANSNGSADDIDYNVYSTIIIDIYVKSRQQALVDIDISYNNINSTDNTVIKPKMLALKSGFNP